MPAQYALVYYLGSTILGSLFLSLLVRSEERRVGKGV